MERTGHCAKYEWKFTWTSHGGNHPEMQVNASGVSGVDVVTTVKTIEDGGLFLDPIPGEFVRIPASKPQVSGLHRMILYNTPLLLLPPPPSPASSSLSPLAPFLLGHLAPLLPSPFISLPGPFPSPLVPSIRSLAVLCRPQPPSFRSLAPSFRL